MFISKICTIKCLPATYTSFLPSSLGYHHYSFSFHKFESEKPPTQERLAKYLEYKSIIVVM